MKIKLNDKFLLTTDNLNYILNEIAIGEKGKNKGKKYIVHQSFFGTLKGVETFLTNNTILCSKDAKEAMDSLIKLQDEVDENIRIKLNNLENILNTIKGAKK